MRLPQLGNLLEAEPKAGKTYIFNELPIGLKVVPFCGLYLGSYKETPKKGTTLQPMGIYRNHREEP